MRLQPIAALCALVLLVWGLLETASVVAQAQIDSRFDLWPGTLDAWGSWLTILSFAAAVVGVPAILLGVLGMRSRAALHVGALLALASVAMTFVWMLIDVQKFHASWGDIGRHYRDGIAWNAPADATAGLHRWWFFVNDVVLPLAVVVLVLWLLVLVTGAGRRAQAPAPLGYAYVAAPQEDYRYVVAPETPEHEGAPATAVADHEVAEPVPADEADHPVSEEPAAQEPARPADHERVWFVTVQGNDHGPYTRAQLRSYAEEGRLHDGTITHLAGGPDEALADVLG